MNFNDLKDLIRYLKDTTKCTNCKKKFFNRNISILGILPTEAILQLDCDRCNCTTLVTVGRSHGTIKPAINKNEIIDMHTFLNGFNGDFKNLFKSSK